MNNIIKSSYLGVVYISLNLLISCNQINQQNSTNQTNEEDEFVDKLENEPKLFSIFWANMNKSEFNKTVSILKNERKIKESNDSLFYDIDGYTMFLKSDFEEGKLKKITLSSALQPIWDRPEYSPYNLFKEKYKLPELVKKDRYYQEHTFPNSDYAGTLQVYLKNNTTEIVPSILIDSDSNKHNSFKKSNEIEKRLALPQKKITISKDNKIEINFQEVPSVDFKGNSKEGADLVYSLEDWKHEIPFEIKRKYSIGPNEINLNDNYKSFNDQKAMETIGNYLIRKNSKYVSEYYYQNYDLEVTYITKEYNNDEQKNLIDAGMKENELRKRIEKLNKEESAKRKKEALDEI